MAETPRLELEVEEETSLPVPIDVLVDTLSAKLRSTAGDAEEQRWRQFCENLQIVVAQYYDNMTNRIRQSYEAPPLKAKEQGLETRFLRDIVQLFEAAQYSALTQTQWDRAEEGQFEFNFPVEVQWEKLDPDFTRRYFAEYHGGRYVNNRRVPDFAQYVMLFTRGISSTEKADLFIPDKINILIEALWAKVLRMLGRKPPAKGPDSARDGGGAQKVIRGVKKVRRTTVENICEQEGLLNVFLKKCVVREPVFDHVMVCYRLAPSRKEKQLMKAAQKMRKGQAAFDGGFQHNYSEVVGVDDRPLKIELYDKIPFGDLDSVLPAAQINLRPLDTLVFCILVLVAGILIFITFCKIFFAKHEDGVLGLIITFVVVAIKETLDLLKDWKTTRMKYTQKVNEYRQRRTVAAGMPVITNLVDDVKQQELKEMILGYFFLWTSASGGRGRPASLPMKTVDNIVEEFMSDEFKLKMDFEVEDSFLKLESLGLVAADPSQNGFYRIQRDPEQWLRDHPTEHLASLKLRPDGAESARDGYPDGA